MNNELLLAWINHFAYDNCMTFSPPPPDCPHCPRLVAFREDNQRQYPDFFNGAVPAFGSLDARILIVGLAPGLKGANATGRPFTGDYAGDVLYESLLKAGLARGHYDKRADDGLELLGVRITNAVRCVPPENKPVGEEIKRCNSFLSQEINAMPRLRVILSLGNISHNAVLKALGYAQSQHKFSHGALHSVGQSRLLLNSYHCSRYNMNTKRLTQEMFDAVVIMAQQYAHQG